MLRLLMPGFVAVALLCLAAIVIAASKSRRPRRVAGHRGSGRSRAHLHRARHAVRARAVLYTPRHEEATAGPVALGNTVDGDITLVHADVIADEPTDTDLEALLGPRPAELIGASS